MQTELVSVTTPEGILLSGAYFEARAAVPGRVDAVLFLHGDGGHFYAPLYLGLGAYLADKGIACLLANRRGHDLIARGVRGGPWAGYAFESVADARIDVRCWLDLLVARGHRAIGLGGHSGGAVRAVYAEAEEAFAETATVIAVSPGEYRHRSVLAAHGVHFETAYREALLDVGDGKGEALRSPGLPWSCLWSAAAFVDCFNPDDRYSVTRHAARLRCPSLFVFGAAECDGPEQLPVCGAARANLAAAHLPRAEISVLPEANHAYAGCERALYETLSGWLRER